MNIKFNYSKKIEKLLQGDKPDWLFDDDMLELAIKIADMHFQADDYTSNIMIDVIKLFDKINNNDEVQYCSVIDDEEGFFFIGSEESVLSKFKLQALLK